MQQIQEAFWEKRSKLQGLVKNKDHPKASLLAIVLNIIEDSILNEIVNFEGQNFHRNVDVLMFDGCQIRKDVNNPLTVDELTQCSEWVKQQTGYRVSIIEKPMDEVIDLTDCAPILHLTCRTEYEAALALKQLHGEELFKYCDGMLFVYDKRTGLWNCDEKTVHQQLLRDYSIEMGTWLETVTKWSKLYCMLQTHSVDSMFLKRVQLSSLGKILFQNGYYDFEAGTFSDEFNHELFFPFRIERPYNAVRNQQHIDLVNQTLFVLPFETVETGKFVKCSLSRGLAGCIRDKRIYFNIGPPNAGKGVLTDAMCACGEKYVGTFNGGILQCQGDKDCSLRNKECMKSDGVERYSQMKCP
jgi:hypothetical protein